ncbi:hypothetical protein [Epilithonimonas tenax]|uniref:hypothetical protein n=1 Tax=Epilithonimonas tenax TaxID=191577 RepID=UPI0003FF426A|nr:hypothetical protein [Epilithonimonas tenax]
MRNIILSGLLITTLLSCDFGPKGALNEDFEEFDRTKDLPFRELIGEYELDKDSKKRYNISDTANLRINIVKDTSFIVRNIVNYKDRTIIYNKTKYKTGYVNNYKDKHPSLFFNLFSKDFNGGGTINLYYRKRDSAIALYIYTPVVEATKENNMQYIEGDYLRYIKIKDSSKK